MNLENSLRVSLLLRVLCGTRYHLDVSRHQRVIDPPWTGPGILAISSHCSRSAAYAYNAQWVRLIKRFDTDLLMLLVSEAGWILLAAALYRFFRSPTRRSDVSRYVQRRLHENLILRSGRLVSPVTRISCAASQRSDRRIPGEYDRLAAQCPELLRRPARRDM
jgi:hypothetical protein